MLFHFRNVDKIISFLAILQLRIDIFYQVSNNDKTVNKPPLGHIAYLSENWPGGAEEHNVSTMYYLPLEKGVTLHLNNLESLCQLSLVENNQMVLRKRGHFFFIFTMTKDRQQTHFNKNSSLEP